MLEQLVDYAKQKGLIVEPGFEPRDVRWGLMFDRDGRFLNVVELGDTSQRNNRGRRFLCCPVLSFSELRGGGKQPRSHSLVETADAVALMAKEPHAAEADTRIAGKHGWFVDTMKRLADGDPPLAAVAETLSDDDDLAAIRIALAEQKAKPTDKVTIGIVGGDPVFPLESERWHGGWRALRASLDTGKKPAGKKASKKAASPGMRCLVTGEMAEPMPVHPKIAGLSDVGGLSMGDVLTGFKQDSFRSFGLQQAANAAVSEAAATAYSAALNDLIRHQSQRLATARVAHWFKDSVLPEDDPLPWLAGEADETAELDATQRAQRLLRSIRTGDRPDLAANRYYALTLSGNSGRVMIRDWMEGPFEELVESIHRWFDDLSIVARDGKGLARVPKFMAVLGATVRDLNDLPPPFVAALWRVALRRLPIPRQAMTRALNRTRIDIVQNNPANHARMGLLKAYHLRKGDRHMTPALNEDHPHPAYHCGRLMAVLADLQRAALGDVGAGLIQRYYAAASATPALVLGRLLRTSQFHVNKLEPGLAHWFEQRKAEVLGHIAERIPTTLTLDEQSLFALGYYHQMAAPRKAKPPIDEQRTI